MKEENRDSEYTNATPVAYENDVLESVSPKSKNQQAQALQSVRNFSERSGDTSHMLILS